MADDTAVAPGGGGVTESGGGGLLEQAETGLTPVDLEFVNPHGVRFTATAQTSSEGQKIQHSCCSFVILMLAEIAV